jgi:DNA-binding response OmpR family regulator
MAMCLRYQCFNRAVGFAVDSVASCGDAQAALGVGTYDAMILDLGLPDGDGLALLGQVRSGGDQTPILVLTARDAIEDRVNGLDAGADDYLIKPFAMTELIARTKALLRRPGGALGTTLKAGNVSFDTIGRDVTIGNRARMPVAMCFGTMPPESRNEPSIKSRRKSTSRGGGVL